MRRLFVYVFALLLIAGTAYGAPGMWGECEMVKEPLGWSGWAWGTLFESVKGELNKAGVLSEPFIRNLGHTLYTRQGQNNNYLSVEWKETYYIFEDEKLCAVMLIPPSWGRFTLIDYFAPSNGAWSRTGEKGIESVYYKWAKGTEASLLYICETNGPGCVIIGRADMVNLWIDIFMSTHSSYVEYMKVNKP